MRKLKLDLELEACYADYLQLLAAGRTHEEALIEFDWLHPIRRARLEALIKSKIRGEKRGVKAAGGGA